MTGRRVLLAVGSRWASDVELEAACEERGLELRTVETVATAAAELADADCVVTEAHLPDGSGLDLCRRITRRRPDVAVALSPETGSDELAREAIAAGIDEYLPWSTVADVEELLDSLEAMVDRCADADDRFRTLVEQTTDVVVVFDIDGTIQYVSPVVESMLGYAPSDLVGNRGDEYVHPADVPRLRETLVDAIRGEDFQLSVEFRARHADDSWRWLAARGESFVDDPSIEGLVFTLRDVTDRKERQRELELYERMLNAVPDMVYALDDEGKFVAVNETAAEMVGRPREAFIGDHVSAGMSEVALERGQEVILDLLKSDDRDKAIYEMDLYDDHGGTTPVENHVALLLDDDGAFRGTVGVIRDVSDRKRRERRLTVLNRTLRHDLRNSMHVILANAELLDRETEDPDLRERIRKITERAEAVNGLSEKAREIEEAIAMRDSTTRRIDIAPILSRQVATFRERFPGADLTVDGPGHAWVAATDLIDRAVANLVENSLEHAGDEPTVSVSIDVGGEFVSVTVADDGPGIPEKERRVVMQGSETPLDHASGLGLWLVAWITRDSGGTVAFEDSEEWGSVVRLDLPAADPPPDVTDASTDADPDDATGSTVTEEPTDTESSESD